MIKPYKNANRISQYFSKQHEAIDFWGTYAEPLVAVEDGTVMWTREGTYTPDDYTELRKGYNIRIKGVSGREWLYEHCHPIFPVSLGDKVKAGQIIAYMGNSGNVLAWSVLTGRYEYIQPEDRTKAPHQGTHLHLECWENGVRIDPLPLLTEEPRYTIFDQMKATMVVLGKISGLISG
jgi:murein DD-endopeptidase MepM/ murein hydrolase activator NlpD